MHLSYYHPLIAPMNPWERNALDYNLQNNTSNESASTSSQAGPATNSIIYPGIYAPSGLDIMSILTRVVARPSPVVQLGPVDASCAVVVCDINEPDCPIVYVNEPYMQLTGYSLQELVGKNCRFMQAPGGDVQASSVRNPHVEKGALRQMRRAVESRSELALEVTNFKKNGQRFTNFLTIIPICWCSSKPRYYIGFLAEKTKK
ncbi:vivid PAS protein VVD [Xylaria nigripes]|nr:vivid PAS protein VVD [Xylaria nigripes]